MLSIFLFFLFNLLLPLLVLLHFVLIVSHLGNEYPSIKDIGSLISQDKQPGDWSREAPAFWREKGNVYGISLTADLAH